MKIYGVPQSPFVRKAIIALEEKGIPYDNEPLIPLPKTPARRDPGNRWRPAASGEIPSRGGRLPQGRRSI